MSLPSRGAWIEITAHDTPERRAAGRSPHGERGLKSGAFVAININNQVAPLTGSVD